MVCRFRFRAAARRTRGSPGAVGRSQGMDPLERVLLALRGREVRLLVGRREVQGRLLDLPPVRLVSAGGRVHVVPVQRIASVAF